MENALKLLAALLASASAIFLVWIFYFIFQGVLPNLPELNENHRKTLGLGLLMAYWMGYVVIFGMLSRMIWTRTSWKRAVIFSGLSCLGLPIGPLLGVASLVLLTRPAVKARFKS